jgi:hypothetical protein
MRVPVLLGAVLAGALGPVATLMRPPEQRPARSLLVDGRSFPTPRRVTPLQQCLYADEHPSEWCLAYALAHPGVGAKRCLDADGDLHEPCGSYSRAFGNLVKQQANPTADDCRVAMSAQREFAKGTQWHYLQGVNRVDAELASLCCRGPLETTHATDYFGTEICPPPALKHRRKM